MRKQYVFVVITCFIVVILSPSSMFAQSWNLESGYGDDLRLFIRKGKLFIENKSYNSLSVNVFKEKRVIQRVTLAPGELITDAGKFFQRSSSEDTKQISLTGNMKDLDNIILQVSYDESAYNMDDRIMRNEIERNIILRALDPIKNTMIRLLGGGNLLIMKSVFETGFSDLPVEEKRQRFAEIIVKTGIASSIENKAGKLIFSHLWDYVKSLNSRSSDPIFEFLLYCAKRYSMNKIIEFPLKNFDIKLFPKATFSIGVAIPLNPSLENLRGRKISNTDNILVSEGPLFSDQSPFGVEVIYRTLSRNKNFYSSRLSTSIIGSYERGPMFYKNGVNNIFSDSIAISHDKIGLALGYGLRALESKQSSLAIDVDFTVGGLYMREAESLYGGMQPTNSIISRSIFDDFVAANLTLSSTLDLGVLMIRGDWKRQIAIGENSDGRFFYKSVNISVLLPLYRKYDIQ